MGHCHHLLFHTVDHLSCCAVILHSRHATCFLWLCWISSYLHLHLHDHNQFILISFSKALRQAQVRLMHTSTSRYIYQAQALLPLHHQDQARLVVRCARCTLWQKVIGASAILWVHCLSSIQYSCNISCYHAITFDQMTLVNTPFAFWHPICLLTPPFHLMWFFSGVM